MASKPVCKYGAKCYRHNPQHLRDFDHPSENDAAKHDDDSKQTEVAGKVTRVGRGLKRKSTEDNSRPQVKRNNTRGGQKNTLDNFFACGKKRDDNDKESAPCNSISDTGDATSDLVNKNISHDECIESTSDAEDQHLIVAVKEVDRKVKVEFREDLLSCDTVKQKIDAVYSVKMPEDFYQFWEFCCTQNKENPEQALRPVGLSLVGPFDIFSKKMEDVSETVSMHLHYRYYYDPPEFMTVIAGTEKQFHVGYFRDDPNDLPVFVASNSASDNCLITPRGENLFATLKWYLEKHVDKQACQKILQSLADFAEEKKICLDTVTPKMKQRQKKVVCKTFHGAGLVVPVDQNDVGYRPVPETPANLKRMLKKIVDSKSEDERNTYLEPIEEIITYIQFANDECDYGEGIELGLDLLSFGGEVLHPFISSLLCVGYSLLNRELYSNIVKAFLPLRQKDRPLTMFSTISK